MCRLFGMSGAPHQVKATFWLVEVPGSLAARSGRNPEGTCLGIFHPDCRPWAENQPMAAFEDSRFADEARHGLVAAAFGIMPAEEIPRG